MKLVLILLYNATCFFWLRKSIKDVRFLSNCCAGSNPYLRAAKLLLGYAIFISLLGIILLILYVLEI